MLKFPLCILAYFLFAFYLQVQRPSIQCFESEDFHADFCHTITKPLILQT